ncbi:MAG: polysaccharide deacetylase family protein [Clostridiales bacterium]|nr:polysaccharide deacetylase family protein [Clostridiales bacterium]
MKRTLRLFSLLLCLMLCTSTALALPANYVVRNGDREVPRIAITVDDGWELETLYQIHALSVELDFPITYFMVGSQFKHEDRGFWEEVFAHGSELGNHTWKHSKLLSFSTSNANTQVRLAQERVDEVLGYHYPLRLLRPPYGQYKNNEKNFLNVFYSHGVEKVVLWDVSETNPQKAFKDVKNGSILLYHARKADYECLKTLVPMLKDAGYELVTVTDLLGLEPLVIERPESTKAPD